jgi:hypothetical protein
VINKKKTAMHCIVNITDAGIGWRRDEQRRTITPFRRQPPRTRLDPANFVLGCSSLYRGRPNSAAALPEQILRRSFSLMGAASIHHAASVDMS